MRGGKVLILMSGLLLSSAASANDADSTPKPAVAQRPAKTSPARLQQRVTTHQAEVQQLQQDVSKQEQASRQASEQLQQQDKVIADLQKQLQDAHTKPAANQH